MITLGEVEFALKDNALAQFEIVAGLVKAGKLELIETRFRRIGTIKPPTDPRAPGQIPSHPLSGIEYFSDDGRERRPSSHPQIPCGHPEVLAQSRRWVQLSNQYKSNFLSRSSGSPCPQMLTRLSLNSVFRIDYLRPRMLTNSPF